MKKLYGIYDNTCGHFVSEKSELSENKKIIEVKLFNKLIEDYYNDIMDNENISYISLNVNGLNFEDSIDYLKSKLTLVDLEEVYEYSVEEYDL